MWKVAPYIFIAILQAFFAVAKSSTTIDRLCQLPAMRTACLEIDSQIWGSKHNATRYLVY